MNPTPQLVKSLFASVCLTALAACQTPTASTTTPSPVKTMEVNGTRLPWVEQGRGEPVVFVNPAVADHRTWEHHLAALASRNYRAIAYSQRYFGTALWDSNWPAFGVQTHAEDLAAFISGLNAGPVHLVAWSYSGHTVLHVASKNPELVRSAFVFEPGVPSYVGDPAALKALGEDAGATFGAAAKAIEAGDLAASVRELIDGVGERKGTFDGQPAAVKAIQLDNARTMPLLFADKAPPLSCAQLAQIKPPVAMVRSAEGRPFFRLIAEAGARCLADAEYIVVPSGGHMHLWPGADVAGFNATLAGFLDGL